MRKSIFWLALGAGFVATPAAAQEVIVPGTSEPWHEVTRPGETEIREIPASSRWYVGGEFGAMIVEDTDVDIGAVDNALRLSHDYGYDGGLFVGYDLGGFRIEAEAAYKKADLDSYNTTIRLPLEGPNFATSRNAGGNTSVLSFMINGMLDFGDDDGISGFVGGGVGMARVKANNYRNFSNATPFLDDSDSKLAWQVFAGVRQAITDNIDVTVKYRFFNVDKVRMTAFNGQDAELRFRSHSLLGGITFRFGSKRRIEVCKETGAPITAANPCATTICEQGGQVDPLDLKCPDPTTAAMRRCTPDGPLVALDYVCVRGPFIVFFDWDRSVLSKEAMDILDNAAAQYDRTGSAQVSIEGHADTSGRAGYNEGLSQARVAAVRDYLVGRQIPESVMVPMAYGERCPAVDSGDGVREPQNRRVEIYYGPRDHQEGVCPSRPY